MNADFSITTAHEGSRYVVKVVGEVDMATAPLLDEALASPTPDIAVDLSNVTFMDSTGLKALVKAHRRTEDCGGTFRISAVSANVRRLLEIAALDDYLHIDGGARTYLPN